MKAPPTQPVAATRPSRHAGRGRVGRGAGWVAIGLGLWLGLGTARGAIQFDVFLGYGSQPTGADGVVHEVGWFAVGCEVLNDGPAFNATVEVSSAQFGGGQTRRLNVELPTNTRKRFGLPAFLGLNAYATWDARLLDERGRVRAELRNLRPRMVSWEGLLVAAVPRSFGGSPKFPPLKGNNAQSAIQPLVARMAVEQVPDDPIALEGLNALYLNSEKAVELKAGQADALSAWVWGGGHLVLAVEQPADLAAAPWLRRLAPVDFSRVVSAKPGPALHRWLVLPADQGFHIDLEEAAPEGMPQQVAPPQYRGPGSTKPGSGPADGGLYHNLEPDKSIEPVEFPVAVGRIRDGQVELALGDTPLIIRVQRGRGMVTILAFSPEREPFRSWKHRDWFWVRLLAPPAMWFGAQQFMTWGGTSVDGVFGGMIDSTQVRKLPVPALLLLLVVYLVVIGPLDHYVLKRLNRQMWTWVTFPLYVVFFSVLIYYIGYRLRAGETECNELHMVDILPQGPTTAYRGRTYVSIYSPVNARYRLASGLTYATLRNEFLAAVGGGQEVSRLTIEQLPKGFQAEVAVPVWSSQLFVSDWWSEEEAGIQASLTLTNAGGARLRIENKLDVGLAGAMAIYNGRVYDLGSLAPGAAQEVDLEHASNRLLIDLVRERVDTFKNAVVQRQQAFGSSQAGQLTLELTNLTAVSFLGASSDAPQAREFVAPAGVDLGRYLDRGDAVVLAWLPRYSPVPSFRQFEAVRSAQNCLLRLVVAPSGAAAP